VKIKYLKKAYVHDSVSVVAALNADNEKYLNYEATADGGFIGCVCTHCHRRRVYNFFGVPRKFKPYIGGHAKVISPEEFVLKERANIRLLVDDEGLLLEQLKVQPALLLLTSLSF